MVTPCVVVDTFRHADEGVQIVSNEFQLTPWSAEDEAANSEVAFGILSNVAFMLGLARFGGDHKKFS